MHVPITSDLAGYQAYWNRVLLAACVWAGCVLGMLAVITWKVMRL